MTTNHHTAIATGAAANAANFNSPLSQLDAALTSALSGGTAITQANFGTETTLTIASGAVAVTRTRHQLDTEGAAATDALTDITGGAVGDVVFLRSVSAARVTTITHNVAKIFLSSRQDLALDDPLLVIALVCVTTAIWVQIDPGFALSLSANNSLKYFRDLAVRPALAARNNLSFKAAAATIQASGVAAPTATGTLSELNDTDSTYINILSGASAGDIAGYVSATFDLVRRQYNPKIDVIIRLRDAADIAAIRIYVGLTSAVTTNVDSLVGVASFAGFRYSTVAADAGFVPVTCDNATQNVGSMITGGAIAASTRYLLSMEIDDSDGTATFRINNGTASTLSANLPAASTELGFVVYLRTTAAVAKNWKFSRMSLDYD